MEIVTIAFLFVVGGALGTDLNNNYFPAEFKFGVSTAAYQIEGAWKQDGRGPSVWDDFVHEHPEKIRGNATGDVACDSYHLYQEDVALLRQMNAQFYRFSISWSRILPHGTSQKVNQDGVAYYLNLLKLLKESNIEPIVTLYHWDLPTPLQQMGGWTNPDIVKYFGDYARLCFKYFGEHVKYWVTLNEPQSSCIQGYAGGFGFAMAPGYHLTAEGTYLCAYTHAKAHALAYHIYHDEFKKRQQGKVSLSLVSDWYEAASTDAEDQTAQELALQFNLGLFAHPIFVGNWPQVVIDRVGNRSSMEGLPQSRLPAFTQEEVDYIKGTYDWYGLNYYVTSLTKLQYKEDDAPGNASFYADGGYTTHAETSWKVSNSTSNWLVQVPWGLTKTLKWVHDNYNQPDIIITENGWSDDGTSLNDTDRIEYVGLHLSSVLDAINELGVNVIGYTQWSLLDNFEWGNGYTSKFGIVSVNFSSVYRDRTPKQSYYWYRNVIRSKCLVDKCVASAATLNKISLITFVATCILSKLF